MLADGTAATFVGSWRHGEPEGVGTLTTDERDGVRYVGGLRRGAFEGEGLLRGADGREHRGGWRAGRPHGHGVSVDAPGHHLPTISPPIYPLSTDPTNSHPSPIHLPSISHPPPHPIPGDVVHAGEWARGHPSGGCTRHHANGDFYEGSCACAPTGTAASPAAALTAAPAASPPAGRPGTTAHGARGVQRAGLQTLQREGEGVCMCANGDVHRGGWRHDLAHGQVNSPP